MLDELRPYYRRLTRKDADAYVQERDLLDRLVRKQGYDPVVFVRLKGKMGRAGSSEIVSNIPDEACVHDKEEDRWLDGRDALERTKAGTCRYNQYITRTPVTMAVLHELHAMVKDPSHGYKTTAPYYFAKLLITLDNHWD